MMLGKPITLIDMESVVSDFNDRTCYYVAPPPEPAGVI